MANSPKRESMLRMMVELVEDIVVLLFLEIRLALWEVRDNVKSVERGAVMVGLGAGLFFFALLVFTATAVLALALVLPGWLAALLVALGLAFFGAAFLFSGLAHFKDFTLLPVKTAHRVEDTFREYRKVSAEHHAREERNDPQGSRRHPGTGHLAD